MSALRIAITRAQPEADRTAEKLRTLGADPVVAPLLETKDRAFDADITGVQALLFTSANGVRATARKITDRALPTLAVGDATARAARDAGFQDVRSAGGDVAALSALANGSLNPKAGTLLYLSGADVAADLVGWLIAAGFTATRRIVYEARVVDHKTVGDLIKQLKSEGIIKSLYRRVSDGPGVFAVMEANDLEDANKQVGRLPFVANGLLEWHFVEIVQMI